MKRRERCRKKYPPLKASLQREKVAFLSFFYFFFFFFFFGISLVSCDTKAQAKQELDQLRTLYRTTVSEALEERSRLDQEKCELKVSVCFVLFSSFDLMLFQGFVQTVGAATRAREEEAPRGDRRVEINNLALDDKPFGSFRCCLQKILGWRSSSWWTQHYPQRR